MYLLNQAIIRTLFCASFVVFEDKVLFAVTKSVFNNNNNNRIYNGPFAKLYKAPGIIIIARSGANFSRYKT